MAQCQACHSLQFDPSNPELTLPHGDTTAVRGFLRTLPTQYADLAVKKGITKPNEIKDFVTWQMLQLRERVRIRREDFEYQVFFVADPYKLRPGTEPRIARLVLWLRALPRGATGGERGAFHREAGLHRSLDAASQTSITPNTGA